MNWDVNTKIVIEKYWEKFEAELRQYEASFRWKVLARAVDETPEKALMKLMEQINEKK